MNLPVELQPGESVVLRVRRHPVYMVSKLAGVALTGLVPIVLLLWLVSATAGLSDVVGTVTIGLCVVWAVIWLVVGYFVWYRHENDLWIITNQRLIDGFKKNWFDQQVSSADLINVQDIAVRRSGLLATMFNFGDVVCQTAGTDARFTLSGIPRPNDVLSVIDARRDAARLEVERGGVLPGEPPPARFVPSRRPPLPDAVPPKQT